MANKTDDDAAATVMPFIPQLEVIFGCTIYLHSFIRHAQSIDVMLAYDIIGGKGYQLIDYEQAERIVRTKYIPRKFFPPARFSSEWLSRLGPECAHRESVPIGLRSQCSVCGEMSPRLFREVEITNFEQVKEVAESLPYNPWKIRENG